MRMSNPVFQGVWAILHFSAAVLHFGSAMYHLNRLRGSL